MARASTRPASTRQRCSAPGATLPCRAIAGRSGICFSPTLTSQEQASSDPDPLAAAPELRGGVERRASSSSSPTATARSRGRADDVSAAILDPDARSRSRPATRSRLCRPSAAPSQFVSDGGVVYAFSSIPLAFIGAAVPTVAGTYGMIARGTYIFATADEGKPVVITFTAQSLTGYTPNLTPAYALTDLDFVDEKGQQGPGPGRARRRFFAADHPAGRGFEPRQPIFARRRSRRATRRRSRSSARASDRRSRRTRFATSSSSARWSRRRSCSASSTSGPSSPSSSAGNIAFSTRWTS